MVVPGDGTPQLSGTEMKAERTETSIAEETHDHGVHMHRRKLPALFCSNSRVGVLLRCGRGPIRARNLHPLALLKRLLISYFLFSGSLASVPDSSLLAV